MRENQEDGIGRGRVPIRTGSCDYGAGKSCEHRVRGLAEAQECTAQVQSQGREARVPQQVGSKKNPLTPQETFGSIKTFN